MQQTALAAPPPFHKGVCYAHAWRGGGEEGYGSATSAKTLARLRDLGVDWVSLTPFGFMPSSDSDVIQYAHMPAGGETDARMVAETEHAHALGLKVAWKPHLWIHNGSWQGALTWPDDAAFGRWFEAYRGFIRHHAQVAARACADLFVIGTELKTAALRAPAVFRVLIAELRKVYSGPMTYAANWDEAAEVRFWDALDYVGVDAYPPVVSHSGATLAELRAGWRGIAASLGALAKKTGRPILLTEFGYRAVRDAALAPAAWPEADSHPRFDGPHQADCYRAALEALWGQPWLAGIYVWKWFTDSRDESGPTDYPPTGKPAEAVLREFYHRPAR